MISTFSLLAATSWALICTTTQHECVHHHGAYGHPENELSFHELGEDDCLPDDFRLTPRDHQILAECWEERGRSWKAGYDVWVNKFHIMHPALACLSSRYNLTTEAGFDMEAMNAMIDSMSSNHFWTKLQKENSVTCQHMMNDLNLDAEQQGVFMTFCFRNIAILQCSREKTKARGGDAAVDLMDMGAGECAIAQKHRPETISAWTSCEKIVGLDGEGKGEALYEAAMEFGPIEGLVEEMQSVVSKTVQVLTCTMKNTGEADEAGVVNYAAARQHMNQEEDKQNSNKKLRLSVLNLCELKGSRTVEQMAHCWWKTAPVACISAGGYIAATN